MQKAKILVYMEKYKLTDLRDLSTKCHFVSYMIVRSRQGRSTSMQMTLQGSGTAPLIISKKNESSVNDAGFDSR